VSVELITIGDELLLGLTIDTNAAHLARSLAEEGIAVARRATVGDDAAAIADAVRGALDRTGAVITTGGLGPTADDLTKPAIAALFGRDMRLDDQIVEDLRNRWKARGWPGELPAANVQQALIPDGARILPNRHGSAPGIWLEDARGRWVAMLPGVPREMRGMATDTLLPLLRERGVGGGSAIRSRTLRTTAIAESALADRLAELARSVEGLPLAYLPGVEGVDLRLTAHGLPSDEAEAVLARAAALVRDRVGRHIYGEDGADLAAVVLQLCRERGVHVAVAESCTGGLLGARLTAIPGASDVVVGGIIAYDDRIKRELLGIGADVLREHGAVSEPVVRQMAAGARRALLAEIGIGITGIAGPDGGSPEKPVGTVWIAADVNGVQRAARSSMVGDREEIRQRAAQAALEMVRRMLLDETVRAG
jgi:nicotinamide-nucleotide amidase